jgi:hypothetical protein
MKKQLTQLEPILLVDSHHGIYMAQIFCSELLAGNYQYKNATKEDIEYLANTENMNAEDYFDTVNDLEQSIILLDKEGNEYNVMFNEDLWAVPIEFDTEDWFI